MSLFCSFSAWKCSKDFLSTSALFLRTSLTCCSQCWQKSTKKCPSMSTLSPLSLFLPSLCQANSIIRLNLHTGHLYDASKKKNWNVVWNKVHHCDCSGSLGLSVCPFRPTGCDFRFILELECSSSNGLCSSSSTLNIIETNSFKHLTHLALKFLPGSDSDVKKYLADCLKKLKVSPSAVWDFLCFPNFPVLEMGQLFLTSFLRTKTKCCTTSCSTRNPIWKRNSGNQTKPWCHAMQSWTVWS